VSDLPSWVFFPDSERTEWANKIIVQLWPAANACAANMAQRACGESSISIQKVLLLLLFSIMLLVQCSLGDIPPRIGGIRAYDRLSSGEIVLDADLAWASNCQFRASAAGVPVSLADVYLAATIRIQLAPLLDDYPIGKSHFWSHNGHALLQLAASPSPWFPIPSWTSTLAARPTWWTSPAWPDSSVDWPSSKLTSWRAPPKPFFSRWPTIRTPLWPIK